VPCGRLELAPSRAWAIGWTAWLLLAVSAILAAAALPWAIRITLSAALILHAWFWLRRTVWLRGVRALRAVEWSAGPLFVVEAGERARRLTAIPAPGCQRYGARLWILRFDTPEGRLGAVVDASMLEPRASRRLARHLALYRRGELLPSRPKV
jgi:hypothetical protein